MTCRCSVSVMLVGWDTVVLFLLICSCTCLQGGEEWLSRSSSKAICVPLQRRFCYSCGADYLAHGCACMMGRRLLGFQGRGGVPPGAMAAFSDLMNGFM